MKVPVRVLVRAPQRSGNLSLKTKRAEHEIVVYGPFGCRSLGRYSTSPIISAR